MFYFHYIAGFSVRVCARACVCLCVFVCARMCVCVCMHACVRACVCVPAPESVCVRVYVCGSVGK